MNIGTKHRLATAIVLATIGVIAAAVAWAYTEVEDASRQRRQTTEIVRHYTELRLASFDYLRNRQERARAQWYAASERIDRLIAANHFAGAEQKAIVAGLRARRTVAPRLFAELVATPVADSGDLSMRRFEAQLVSRLLIDQQDSLADAFRLTQLASERIDAAQRRVLIVILAGLALIALIAAAMSWLVRRQVLAPIVGLQRVTRAVAAGNLNLGAGAGGKDEIGELSRNFDAMTQSLRESFAVLERNNGELAGVNRELDAFSYSVSHDLRAPLRSLEGFSLVLLEDYGDKLDEEGRDALQRIRAACRRMGDLIDALLRLSRVTAAELDVTRIDLSAMAREIAAEIEGEAPGHAVEWRIEPDLKLDADAPLLRVGLKNLLQNAWKFTARTARPVIRVGVRHGEGGTEFFVADNGAGFDMAFADRLFGAFQRLHRAEEFPGTGIGLAIVQRIIRRHGGDIRAEARAGEGASFHFSVKESKNE